jgi:Uma2 family endonuclease
MSPVGFRHAACVKRLIETLTKYKGSDVLLDVQNPIHLPENSEPEPDIVLMRARDDFYIEGHPEPEDILLVIEVSETSFGYDFDVKIPLYGKSGILEAWLVDLQRNELLVFTQPAEIGYKQQLRLQKGDVASPQALSFSLPVADILV